MHLFSRENIFNPCHIQNLIYNRSSILFSYEINLLGDQYYILLTHINPKMSIFEVSSNGQNDKWGIAQDKIYYEYVF